MAATDKTTETAWLIERHDLGPTPCWMAPAGRSGRHWWSEDANLAIRFETKEQAEAACNGGHVRGPLIVTEHAFIGAPDYRQEIAFLWATIKNLERRLASVEVRA